MEFQNARFFSISSNAPFARNPGFISGFRVSAHFRLFKSLNDFSLGSLPT
jgi:hypothetical protein